MIKGLLLDLDNTLYEYEKTHAAALDAVIHWLSAELSLTGAAVRTAFYEARRQIHLELKETAASHNRLLYLQRTLEILGMNPLPHALAAYDRYWDAFLETMTLDPEAREFLDRNRNKPICLVSDLTAHIQHRKILKMRLSRYAGHLVTSEEAGKEKPHPYIFLLALSKIGLRADEVCMIGDSYERDALGAARLGIPVFWLNRSGSSRPLQPGVTEVRSLRDVLEVVHD